MKCAIYSAGPSLRSLDIAGHADAYALRIGINSSLPMLPDGHLHWYAAGDAAGYRTSYTMHRPAVGWCCLCDNDRARIIDMGVGWERMPHLIWPDLPALRVVSSPSYSITAAIALAQHLGASSIDVYAHDAATGEPNANGIGTDHYPPERAKKEAQEVGQICRHVIDAGVPVSFIHQHKGYL